MVKQFRRAKDYQKGDEHILGGGEIVQSVLFHAQELMEGKYRLKSAGFSQNSLAQQTAELIGIDQALIGMPNKQPKIVAARNLYSYWATKYMGISQTQLRQELNISPPAVSLSVSRGSTLVEENGYEIRI